MLRTIRKVATPRITILGALLAWGSGSAAAQGQFDFTGFEFLTKQVGPHSYALLAPAAVTNAGFVVGRDAVLVIDAHLTPTGARKILEAVRAVTSLPIRYLVNTTYHGDHTFGNATFPPDVEIVGHDSTPSLIRRDFEAERGFYQRAIKDGPAHLSAVRPRPPTRTFADERLIDLGGVQVRLIHPGGREAFGDGDIVVDVPADRVTFGGNLLLGPGSVPRLTPDLVPALTQLQPILASRVIVPGHGVGGEASLAGPATVEYALGYARLVITAIESGVTRGLTDDDIVASIPLAAASPPGAPAWKEVLPGGHTQNVKRLLAARRARGGN